MPPGPPGDSGKPAEENQQAVLRQVTTGVGGMQPTELANDTRRERRAAARLQIELTIDDSASTDTGSTINISTNGLYFTSTRYLEPLTVLGLRLSLPGEEGESASEAFDVRGVVVRTEPEDPHAGVEQYEIACYFLETTPEFRERLGRYVQSHL